MVKGVHFLRLGGSNLQKGVQIRKQGIAFAFNYCCHRFFAPLFV